MARDVADLRTLAACLLVLLGGQSPCPASAQVGPGGAGQAPVVEMPDPGPIINYPNITLKVDAAGRVLLDGRALGDAEIVPALVAAIGTRGIVRITILGEHLAPSDRLQQVLAIVKTGDFPLVGLMVEARRW